MNKWILGLWVPFFLFALSSKCSWADHRFSVVPSGRVFTNFYFPFHQEKGPVFLQDSASAWLQADSKWDEKVFSKIIFSMNAFGHSTLHESHFKARLREGYAGYFGEGWEIRVGQMIIPWGKLDGISVTDFLSAKDYSFFNPDDEVRRVGAPSFFGSWTPDKGVSPWTLTGVITPVFPKSKLLIAPGQLPSSVIFNQTESISYSLKNWETAVKLSYAGSFWDFSILAFRGWNHLPEVGLKKVDFVSRSIQIDEVFHRYTALGGDISSSFGSWILRAESSYIWTENSDGKNPLIQPSSFNTAVGIERPLGENFRIQVQALVKYYPYWQSLDQGLSANPFLIANQSVAQQNALIQNYQDSIRPLGTLRVSYELGESGFSSEVLFIGNFKGGGYLLRPQMSYFWTDSLKSSFGLEYYNGPRDRPLGVLYHLSNLFAELKWVF